MNTLTQEEKESIWYGKNYSATSFIIQQVPRITTLLHYTTVHNKNTLLLSCRTPRIVFNNTDDENESVLDAKARLRALRLGAPAPAPVWEADERRLYSGAENPLVYGRHHNIQFQCSFDMTYYPFDVQRCHMIFLRNPGAGKFLLR